MKKTWARGKEWYRRQRLASNLCMTYGCKNDRVINRQTCRECQKKSKNYRINRSIKLTQLGLCTRCGQNNYLEIYQDRKTKTKLCELCYLKRMASQHLGAESYYVDLLNLLQKQKFRCAYTGGDLVLGLNASLDHILPRKKYPDKIKDIDNLQWVIRDINTMKSGFEEETFINLVTKMYLYLTKSNNS